MRPQVLQSTRDKHFDSGFTFAQHESRLCHAESAKEAQDQRLGAVSAEGADSDQDLVRLDALLGCFIGRQAGGRDVKRRVQWDLGLDPTKMAESYP